MQFHLIDSEPEEIIVLITLNLSLVRINQSNLNTNRTGHCEPPRHTEVQDS